ncbi:MULTISPECIES: ABC transporter ATP-binding protein [Citricoccus]|uniref:ABC transporter ATP-binding protein n=1 Tax=Citricoccus TaxID=169133 RepID=UPI000255EE05|nr:ABC transporter ATP-binding protein [Citricoccus sp. CH26A]
MTETGAHSVGAAEPRERDLRGASLDTSTLRQINEAGISLKGVTKRYGDKAVVDDIDLVIEPGEFMTLLGPSGSGKTTTLNMIAGFADVTEGLLHIYGKPVAKLPAHKRDIGMVFQNYALFPHMTVEENVAYPLQRRKMPKAEQKKRIAESLQMVRLAEYGGRYPAELSGGQQQRAALARALVYNPRVLLMDEPLGALDKKLREWLQLEIKRIHQEVGSTFVYVTHDQEEALSLSDRIAVFNNGKIEQVGTGVELYERPDTLFVGRFLGESSVLRAPSSTATVRDGNTTLAVGDDHVTVPGERRGVESLAVLVRPENLSLELPGYVPASSTENALPVAVKTATYLGVGWRYDVVLFDGTSGIVRTPNDATRFGPGDQAVVTWDVRHGVLLEDLGEGDESTT